MAWEGYGWLRLFLWFALSGGRQERSPQLPLKPSFTQVLEVELGSPSGAARALMY